MLRRVTASQMVASTTNAPKGNSFPKLGDILVNLSVKNTPKVTRKLRLIGDPYMFFEYTDKQYVPNPTNDPAVRGKTVKVPFPDADVNKSFNRIGHDEQSQCPWKKMGYIYTTQFAQNCFEKQDDGTWVVKILKKGKSIFESFANEQINRFDNPELDDDFPKHLGTRNAHAVRITAEATGKEGPQSVKYSVSYDYKPTYIDDDMLDLLIKAGEPTAEELETERRDYNKARKSDLSMPGWEDMFMYGYPLHKIFKHTPVKVEVAQAAPSKVEYVDEDVELDINPVVIKPPKSAPVPASFDDDDDVPVVRKKAAPKPVVMDDDDDDIIPFLSEED